MFGELKFTVRDQQHCAVLNQDLSWSSQDPEVEDFLNELFVDPNADSWDDLTEAARHTFFQAAARLGADVTRVAG